MATKTTIPNPISTGKSYIDAFDDVAGWIAEPPEDRPLAGAVGRSGRKVCDFYGAFPAVAGFAFGSATPLVGLLCDPYFDRSGYDGPVESPPAFTGGQCEGVSYTIQAQYRQIFTGGVLGEWTDAGGTGAVFGPVATEQVLSCPVGGGNVFVEYRGPTGLPQYLNMAGGITRLCGTFEIRNVSFVRVDGLPDTCGNPPGDGLEPGANPPPPNEPFPPGQEPGSDPDGQPFFFIPDIPSPTPGGDPIPVPDPFGGFGGVGGGGGPTEPPVAGDEQPGVPGDEEFPPPEDGRRWVGCCIRLTTMPIGTGAVPGTSPETILTQVVGNARLLFDSVSGDGYDTPVQIRSAGLCLWEPVKGLSPKGVRVNLKPGFEYVYTPFSVEETE